MYIGCTALPMLSQAHYSYTSSQQYPATSSSPCIPIKDSKCRKISSWQPKWLRLDERVVVLISAWTPFTSDNHWTGRNQTSAGELGPALFGARESVLRSPPIHPQNGIKLIGRARGHQELFWELSNEAIGRLW